MIMWPNGRAAIMGPDQAATTMAMVRGQTSTSATARAGPTTQREAYKAPVRKTFEDFANAPTTSRATPGATWCSSRPKRAT
jgi:3-methylcrotonyl-CoA carboxylase beta subunit